MIIHTKDNRSVILRRLNNTDLDPLLTYLHHLGEETKKRFGPHPFDRQAVIDFYDTPHIHWGYVAASAHTHEIVAYAIIKHGYLEGDYHRYRSYGVELHASHTCAFAPSVADAWQSAGIGNQLFQYILADLQSRPIQQMVLWGGVQADNERAVNYYQRNHFKTYGRFTHNGDNLDMMREI